MEKDFYLEFENKFRGSRSNVIKKLAIYDSLLQCISTSLQEVRLLDVGCGRGEWLQKCKNYGFNCTGVEMNTAACKVCKDFDLNIINQDIFEVFKSYEDSSFDVITAFHFIEHIKHDKLIKFFEEAKRLLSPSGLMILETPSIDNLIVSSRTFYLDPTHLNPINPDSISYIIESLGFDKSKYYYINSGPLHSANNHNLTKVLNGIAQDLLIIATRSSLATNNIFSDKNQNFWEESFTKSLSLLKAATDFDEENLNLRQKIHNIEESMSFYLQENTKLRKKINNIDEYVYIIRKEMMIVQSDIERISHIINHFQSLFIVRLLRKIINILPKLKNKIRNLSIKILKLLFNRFQYINLIFRLTSNSYCTKLFIFILKKIGFNNIMVDKFIVKQKQNTEHLINSNEFNTKVYSRYQSSKNSKRIFDNIISKSDLSKIEKEQEIKKGQE